MQVATENYIQPLDVELVYQALCGTFSYDNSIRQTCDKQIKLWENQAVPGFMISLLKIVSQGQEQSVRLLSAIVAKNTVGSSWRKYLGSMEWSKIPEIEQRQVRDSLIHLLNTESDEKVALHLSLLIANIARYDFPDKWPTLLQELVSQPPRTQQNQVDPRRIRFLMSLKHVLRQLANKRFHYAPSPGVMISFKDIESFQTNARSWKRQIVSQCVSLFPQLRLEYKSYFELMQQNLEGDRLRLISKMAQKCLSCIRELIPRIPLISFMDDYLVGSFNTYQEENQDDGYQQTLQFIENDLNQFLEEAYQNSEVLAFYMRGSQDDNRYQGKEQYRPFAMKIFERILQAVLTVLGHNPIIFGPFVSKFMLLYVNLVIEIPVKILREMATKQKILITRFLGGVFLSRDYNYRSFSTLINIENKEGYQSSMHKLQAANQFMQEMISNTERLRQLIEALITKYVALSELEIQEWIYNPEDYMRQIEVEANLESDSSRSLGVGLLLIMIQSYDNVKVELLSMARQLQGTQFTAQTSLIREALYRVLEESYQSLKEQFNFQQWYTYELRQILMNTLNIQDYESQSQEQQFEAVLVNVIPKAWSLSLVGYWSQELPLEQWTEAYSLVVQHTTIKDTVLCLLSVQGLQIITIETQNELQNIQAAISQGDPDYSPIIFRSPKQKRLDLGQINTEQIDQETLEKCKILEQKLDFMAAYETTLVQSVFKLMERLTEIESMLRILNLVSEQIELLGNKAQQPLSVIAETIPIIWHHLNIKVQQQQQQESLKTARIQAYSNNAISSVGNSNGRAAILSSDVSSSNIGKMHGCLITILSHTLDIFGPKALQEKAIQEVVYPLLMHSTNINNPGSELLIEDALRLWDIALVLQPEIQKPLLDLIPQLIALISSDRSVDQCLLLVDNYLQLGGGSALQPYMPIIVKAIERMFQKLYNTHFSQVQSQQNSQATLMPILQFDTSQEILQVSVFLDSLLTFSSQTTAILGEPFKILVKILSINCTGACPPNTLATFQGFFETLSKLIRMQPQALKFLTQNEQQLEAVIDRWIEITSRKDISEMIFNTKVSALNRYRRFIYFQAFVIMLESGAYELLLNKQRLYNLFSLGTIVIMEQAERQIDDTVYMEEVLKQVEDDENKNYALLKRLYVAKEETLKEQDPKHMFVFVLHILCEVCGPQEQDELMVKIQSVGGSELYQEVQSMLNADKGFSQLEI